MASLQSPQSPVFHSSPSFESESRKWLYYGAAVCAALSALLVVSPTLRQGVFSSAYIPHSYCYLESPGLVWSNVITDLLIGLSYLGISVTLVLIVYRGRRDIPFHSMFLAFGLFIVACGLTHLIEVVTVWHPLYVLSAVSKGLTAAASVTTAAILPFIVPQILLLVQKAKEADQYLHFLESGLSEKDAAHGELRKINELLEGRIRERTVELARLNDQLRTSERQYRLLFDDNPMPMWVFDRATLTFLAVNEAAIRHYGYAREEFLRMTIADIRPAEDMPRLMDALSARTTGIRPPELWRHRKKDGTVIDVEVTSHRITLSGRDAELTLSQDVTEQRKSQERLRQSEERFAKAFHSSPLAITISSEEDGRYIDVNDAFLKLIGHAREELIGKTAQELGIWLDPDARGQMLTQLAHSRPTEPLETLFRTKLGDEVRVKISAERVLLDGRGCVLANTLDITESRRLEEQFRQAQKMEAVGRLAGGVAHDFNNMLSIILGYCELLHSTLEPGIAARKYLDQIRQAVDRASSLTRQLLTFSRQQIRQPRILNLNSVVHNTSQMLLRVLGEDITLSLRPYEPIGSVKADLGQLEQVLMNLAVNSRDAMPKGGRIVIETAHVEADEVYVKQHPGLQPGQYVMLSFSDTGCGMDKKTLSHIFEPFFTTKEPGKGTGLGLSTVYGIVKQSGGHIWAHSEPAQGTTFKIYLPRVEQAAETLAPPKPDPSFDRGTEAILLVEDDTALRALIAELLRGAGYTVVEAPDGGTAIQIVGQNSGSLDMVLTDLIMPGMNGSDLTLHLRKVNPKLAILFMSGHAGDLISRAGIPEPERFVLHKPFTRKSLLRKVRSILDQRAG